MGSIQLYRYQTHSKKATFQQQFTIQNLFEIGKRQIIVLS